MNITLADGGALRVSDDQLAMVADYIGRLLDAGIEERDANADSWKQSRDDYENQPYPYVSRIIEGADDLPAPFAFPRAEALSDYTVTGIVTQSPMVTCLIYGDEGDEANEDGVSVQEARERTMDTVLRRARVEEKLKSIAPACWWANAGILRVAPGDQDSPIQLDPICPEDFVIVGSGAYTVKDSVMVGHRFERSRGDIKRRIVAKQYADVNVEAFPALTPAPGASDAEMVELWHVYPYMDLKQWDDASDNPEVGKNERRYSVVFEPQTKSILSIEEYTYQTPCYFTFGYKAPPVRGFWHPRPLGADMQGPHRKYQCLSNLATLGAAMMAAPPFVAQKGSFSRDQRYGYGEFIEMEAGDLTVPSIRFDIGALQAELARIEREGDAIARINAAGFGQESQQSKTATQSANEAAGMRAGIGGFIETFSAPITEMCEHIEEILARTFQTWKPIYRDQMPVEDPTEFSGKAKWDVPGKVPNLNPQAVLQNVQVLMTIIERVYGLMQVGGPLVLDMGISLLRSAMNAMDWPNPEQVLKPLEGMSNEQEQLSQGGEDMPEMGSGLDGAPGVEGLLQALGAAGGQVGPPGLAPFPA